MNTFIQPDHTNRCPKCKNILTAHTQAGTVDSGHEPDEEEGDITVCGYCSTVLIIDRKYKISEPAEGQLERMYAGSPGLREMVEYAKVQARIVLEKKTKGLN